MAGNIRRRLSLNRGTSQIEASVVLFRYQHIYGLTKRRVSGLAKGATNSNIRFETKGVHDLPNCVQTDFADLLQRKRMVVA